jgi:hypothetical protein
MNRQLFIEWFPQIVYNHHQTGPAGAVVFIPPFRDPFNYNLDPLIPLGVEMVGSAMHSRLVAEGKGGSAMRGVPVSDTVCTGNNLHDTPAPRPNGKREKVPGWSLGEYCRGRRGTWNRPVAEARYREWRWDQFCESGSLGHQRMNSQFLFLQEIANALPRRIVHLFSRNGSHHRRSSDTRSDRSRLARGGWESWSSGTHIGR